MVCVLISEQTIPLVLSEIISNCVGRPSRVLRFRNDLFASFSLGEKEDESCLWSTDINHSLRYISLFNEELVREGEPAMDERSGQLHR